jgi:hypothetical protein
MGVTHIGSALGHVNDRILHDWAVAISKAEQILKELSVVIKAIEKLTPDLIVADDPLMATSYEGDPEARRKVKAWWNGHMQRDPAKIIENACYYVQTRYEDTNDKASFEALLILKECWYELNGYMTLADYHRKYSKYNLRGK